MSFSLKKLRRFPHDHISTCPHSRIVPWLHIDLQRLMRHSFALTRAFSEQMSQVANTAALFQRKLREVHVRYCSTILWFSRFLRITRFLVIFLCKDVGWERKVPGICVNFGIKWLLRHHYHFP